MKMNFSGDLPIYQQIMEAVKNNIISGEWKTGERLLSVRDMAVGYGVNPNTVQRALSELEREGILCSERTNGRIITCESEYIESMKAESANKYIGEFMCKMKNLGCSLGEIIKLIENTERKEGIE